MKNKIEYEKKIILKEENTQQVLQPDNSFVIILAAFLYEENIP